MYVGLVSLFEEWLMSPCFTHAVDPIADKLNIINAGWNRDNERARTRFSPHLLAHIKQARRSKVANKTREKQREAAGEILESTLRRGRKGVPAHRWLKVGRSYDLFLTAPEDQWVLTPTRIILSLHSEYSSATN